MQISQTQEDQEHDLPSTDYLHVLNTTRFACKMCRTIIFDESDIEDPPHTKSKHSFSARKTKSGANVNSARDDDQCQSIFLSEGLDWMGPINQSHEGKLSCPKCHGKLGMYKWHGTQCSCGTWVVPAIMIHKSRIDVIPPDDGLLSNHPPQVIMDPPMQLPVGE